MKECTAPDKESDRLYRFECYEACGCEHCKLMAKVMLQTDRVLSVNERHRREQIARGSAVKHTTDYSGEMM